MKRCASKHMSEPLFFESTKTMPYVECVRPRIVQMTRGVDPLHSAAAKLGLEAVDQHRPDALTLAPRCNRDIVELGNDSTRRGRDRIADHTARDSSLRFVHEPDEAEFRTRQQEPQCGAQRILAAIAICTTAIQIMP